MSWNTDFNESHQETSLLPSFWLGFENENQEQEIKNKMSEVRICLSAALLTGNDHSLEVYPVR